MTYLDEAYRRFKLPIVVVVLPDTDGSSEPVWVIGVGSKQLLEANQEAVVCMNAFSATYMYLAKVKELSHEDQ